MKEMYLPQVITTIQTINKLKKEWFNYYLSIIYYTII